MSCYGRQVINEEKLGPSCNTFNNKTTEMTFFVCRTQQDIFNTVIRILFV